MSCPSVRLASVKGEAVAFPHTRQKGFENQKKKKTKKQFSSRSKGHLSRSSWPSFFLSRGGVHRRQHADSSAFGGAGKCPFDGRCSAPCHRTLHGAKGHHPRLNPLSLAHRLLLFLTSCGSLALAHSASASASSPAAAAASSSKSTQAARVFTPQACRTDLLRTLQLEEIHKRETKNPIPRFCAGSVNK